MRNRPLLVSALVVVCVGAAHAWPPIAPRPTPTVFPAPMLDQLIDRLAELRAQETELQARRIDLERLVRDRLAEQARRLEKVGVSPAVVPARVGPPFHCVDIDRVTPQAEGPLGVVVLPTVRQQHTVVAEPAVADPLGGVTLPTLAPPFPAPVRPASFVSPWDEEAYLSSNSTRAERNRMMERASVWSRPGGLADRFDALGGMPLAYTRWQRENDLNSRRWSDPHFFGPGAFPFGVH